jgi:hypothetical protein
VLSAPPQGKTFVFAAEFGVHTPVGTDQFAAEGGGLGRGLRAAMCGAGLAGAGEVVSVDADQGSSSDVASGPGPSVWLGLAGLRWLVSHHG